eukprot:jgi/Bigna1/52322/estExt_Genewise1Plus.C_70063
MKCILDIKNNVHGSGGEAKFQWDPTGRFLCSCGVNRRAHIWTRSGEKVHEIALRGSGPCLSIRWDVEGEHVAIMQQKCPEIVLYNVHTGDQQVLDLGDGLKSPTFMEWSAVGKHLAVGSAKGNLLLYDKTTKVKQKFLGRHSRAITCGTWAPRQDLLALGSEDMNFTLSKANGDLVEQVKLRQAPINASFTNIKTGDNLNKNDFLLLNLNGKTLYAYNTKEKRRQIELKFKTEYGSIGKVVSYGSSYMLVGFSNGKIVVLSTDEAEIGEEIHNWGNLEAPLKSFSCARSLNRMAAIMGTKVRMIDMQDMTRWTEETKDTLDFSYETGNPSCVEWTSDGQILTVATENGNLMSYLGSIPVLSTTNGILVAYLQSLQSVKIISVADQKQMMEVHLKIEPSFLAIGPTCLAAGMNNHVWFYSANLMSDEKPQLLFEKEYLGTVSDIKINQTHVAVLCQGKLFSVTREFHTTFSLPLPADSSSHVQHSRILFQVTCMGLTNDFVVYSTANACHHYHLESSSSCIETLHDDAKVLKVFPNPEGTRVIVVDSRNEAFVYNVVTDTRVKIDGFPKSSNVIWDMVNEGIFISVESEKLDNPTKVADTANVTVVHGGRSAIDAKNTFFLAPGCHPFIALKIKPGVLCCASYRYWGQTNTGKIISDTLRTHQHMLLQGFRRHGMEVQGLTQALDLNNFTVAFELAKAVDSEDAWKTLGKKALRVLNIEMAIRVYTMLGNAAMVMTLKRLADVADLELLKGHVCMLFHEFEKAQRHFTSSKKRPITALEMRRDLLQWDQALKLAQQLAPDQIPSICREYAQQLEFKGEYGMALRMYNQALSKTMEGGFGGLDGGNESVSHKRVCKAGIARMTLRTGSLQQGLAMVRQSKDKELVKSCGSILEAMRQYGEAAELYRLAEQYEKAAYMYLKTKSFTKLEALMEHITAPKLLTHYAKSMEAQKKYTEAASAYERANDVDNVIRVCLKHLDQPQRAFELVRKNNSPQGAGMVATFCMSNGDYEMAIEFLLMANLDKQAFDRARNHNKMDIYAKTLGDKGTEEQYLRLARYYESEEKFAAAGRNYARCHMHAKAMRLFLRCGEEEIESAIKIVKAARTSPERPMLVRMLHAYLLGEKDGKPKEPKFVYLLYMAIGDHQKASKTAVIIATQEQKIGGYRTAHDLLFETLNELRNNKIAVPNELMRTLTLLHSYIIVRKLVERKKHKDAARMLIRVCKNISKFPAHTVPILTSCVIECARGGLKKSAYEHAVKLMQPEYRPKILQKVRKSIEKMVRRPPTKEEEEEVSPCPFCHFKVPNSLLTCPQCKNDIPFCLITGRHMVPGDFSLCPSCNTTALHSEMSQLAEAGQPCYMCKKVIKKDALKKLSYEEVKAILLKSRTSDDEKKEGKAE